MKEKDKFEQFIERSLKEYSEDPSDQLWEELEEKIPVQPNKKRPFIFWFSLFTIFLLGGIIFWSKYIQDIDQINLALQKQESKINKIEKEFEKINNIQPTKNNTADTIIERKFENQKNKGTNHTSQQSDYKLGNSSKTSSSISPTKKINQDELDISNRNLTTEFIPSENSNLIDPFLKNEKELTSLSDIRVDQIPSLTLLKIEQLKEINFPKRTLPPIDPIELFGNNKRITSFEFFTNIGETFPKFDFQYPINSFKKGRSKNFELGLLYNIHIAKKWILQIGVGFTNRTVASSFNNYLEYGSIETAISDNVFQTKNTYQVNSNYGNQLFTSYFENIKMNDGADIEAGEIFLSNINIIRTQQYFSIPLLIKYTWASPSEKLRWSIKTGVIDRIYFKVNNIGEVLFEKISHPRLAHNYTEVQNIGHGNIATRFGLELAFGTGIEYQFHKNFSLILEPMVKTNIWERTTVTPYTLGVYSGIRWNF